MRGDHQGGRQEGRGKQPKSPRQVRPIWRRWTCWRRGRPRLARSSPCSDPQRRDRKPRRRLSGSGKEMYEDKICGEGEVSDEHSQCEKSRCDKLQGLRNWLSWCVLALGASLVISPELLSLLGPGHPPGICQSQSSSLSFNTDGSQQISLFRIFSLNASVENLA